MNKETICRIIDEICETAKTAVCFELFSDEAPTPKVKGFADRTLVDLKKAADLWDEAGKRAEEVFRNLEKDTFEHVSLERLHALYDKGMKKYGKPSLNIGDEIIFIGNGCAVKDKVSKLLVETENGYQVYVEDAFRTMDELVEHLKQRVHG